MRQLILAATFVAAAVTAGNAAAEALYERAEEDPGPDDLIRRT